MEQLDPIEHLKAEKRELINVLREVLNEGYPKDEFGRFCPACNAYIDAKNHFPGCVRDKARAILDRIGYD